MNILRLSTLSLMTMILIPINGNANCDGIKHAGNHPHCSRAGGALSNEETLTQLLVSTGLSYEFLNAQTVAIQGAAEEVEDSNSGKSQPAASQILMAQNETPPKQPVPQDQAPSGAYAANEQKDSALEEIVVTATRRRPRSQTS